jgi:hypothetical protein
MHRKRRALVAFQEYVKEGWLNGRGFIARHIREVEPSGAKVNFI